MLNKYRVKAKIIVSDKVYSVSDTIIAYSDKQARFNFYNRIKLYFKIEEVNLASKVSCSLLKEDVSMIIDLGFKNIVID